MSLTDGDSTWPHRPVRCPPCGQNLHAALPAPEDPVLNRPIGDDQSEPLMSESTTCGGMPHQFDARHRILPCALATAVPSRMSRASGTDRASRSSCGTTSVSPVRTAAKAWSRPGRSRFGPLMPWSMSTRSGGTPSVMRAWRWAMRSCWSVEHRAYPVRVSSIHEPCRAWSCRSVGERPKAARLVGRISPDRPSGYGPVIRPTVVPFADALGLAVIGGL